MMPRRIILILLSVAGSMIFTGCWLGARQMRPAYAQETDLYINPLPVEISGYNGSAMEPFISLDGKFLFFNTDDDPQTGSKTLHFARRTALLSFRYLGELSGVNLHIRGNVDAAASMDGQGHFYFTSTRQYDRDFHSVFTGNFDGRAVTNVHAVEGDITPYGPRGLVNMDVSISPDGQILYISRARFGGLFTLLFAAPSESHLLVAHRDGDRFTLDPNGATIMKNVDSGFEYAAAISADGLELYFNRGPRIMVASRDSADKPFGKPQLLRAINGFVEGPSISLDRKELFFHKKVDSTCCMIFRATRSP